MNSECAFEEVAPGVVVYRHSWADGTCALVFADPDVSNGDPRAGAAAIDGGGDPRAAAEFHYRDGESAARAHCEGDFFAIRRPTRIGAITKAGRKHASSPSARAHAVELLNFV